MKFRAFLALAALSALGLAFGSIGIQAEERYRVSGPHAHDNLSIYFVHGRSQPGPVPLTLAEALKNKTVEVIETGSVSRLAIENHGDDEVFVQMGDIVKGGKQDRVLTRSLLLPPRSGRVEIGSYCVERGRWSKRGGEDASRFASARRMLTSKKGKMALVAGLGNSRTASLPGEPRQSAELGIVSELFPSRPTVSGQGAIWDDVAETQNKLSAALGTDVPSRESVSSLQLALENDQLNKKIDDYVGALQAKVEGRDDIVGYVFAVNGQINSGDVYPSNGLFQKMWPKLLKAAATEAIGEKTKEAGTAPAIDKVHAFLEDAAKGEMRERNISRKLKLETGGGKTVLYSATRRISGAIVHRSYVAR